MVSLFLLLGSVAVGFLHSAKSEQCPLHSLQHFEDSIFSQNGEDGITTFLLDIIGIKHGTFAEFGVQDGMECNSRILREHYNFTGLIVCLCGVLT